MNIPALAFDTGRKALDWHAGLVRALAGIVLHHGIECERHAAANDWRRTMKHIVGQMHPAFHMDDGQRWVLYSGSTWDIDLTA